jgi:hypothetical protein
MTRVLLLRGQDFSLCHNIQTGSGAYQDTCPLGNGVPSSEAKWLRQKDNHSPSSSAEVKNVCGAIPQLPHMSACFFYTRPQMLILYRQYNLDLAIRKCQVFEWKCLVRFKACPMVINYFHPESPFEFQNFSLMFKYINIIIVLKESGGGSSRKPRL